MQDLTLQKRAVSVSNNIRTGGDNAAEVMQSPFKKSKVESQKTLASQPRRAGAYRSSGQSEAPSSEPQPVRRDERTMNMHGQNLMNPYSSHVNPYQSQFMHMNYPPAPLTPEQLHQ